MLIEVNLAPGSAGKLRARRTRPLSLPSLPSVSADLGVLGGAAVALLLLVLALLGFWRMGENRETLEASILQEVTDSTRFATTIALVESLQARQDTMAQKIAVIREVDTRRYVWPHLLDQIGLAVPAYTWLTQISSSEVIDSINPGPAFSIQGNVGSTPALTRFMKNLEASPFIRDVTLITSEQDMIEGRTLQRFSLEARYRVPEPSVIQTIPIVVIE